MTTIPGNDCGACASALVASPAQHATAPAAAPSEWRVKARHEARRRELAMVLFIVLFIVTGPLAFSAAQHLHAVDCGLANPCSRLIAPDSGLTVLDHSLPRDDSTVVINTDRGTGKAAAPPATHIRELLNRLQALVAHSPLSVKACAEHRLVAAR